MSSDQEIIPTNRKRRASERRGSRRGPRRGRGMRGGRRGRAMRNRRGRLGTRTSRIPAVGTGTSRLDEVVGPWKKEEPSPMNLQYSRTAGPNSSVLVTGSTILQAFFLFFTTEVWSLLVEETNHYATRVGIVGWFDTSIEEMKAFVGMLIFMGILKLPTVELYWSGEYHYLQVHNLRRIMPRDRFFQLLRFVHINSVDSAQVTGNPNYDKLYKVRKLLDIILPKFEEHYIPHQELRSVDEAMIPFQGRLSFKQYLKDKPTKWGIKAPEIRCSL